MTTPSPQRSPFDHPLMMREGAWKLVHAFHFTAPLGSRHLDDLVAQIQALAIPQVSPTQSAYTTVTFNPPTGDTHGHSFQIAQFRYTRLGYLRYASAQGTLQQDATTQQMILSGQAQVRWSRQLLILLVVGIVLLGIGVPILNPSVNLECLFPILGMLIVFIGIDLANSYKERQRLMLSLYDILQGTAPTESESAPPAANAQAEWQPPGKERE
jgi:hypothetical protein